MLIAPSVAMRSANSNEITLDTDACDVNTCMTFKPEHKCSCKPFFEQNRERLRARVGDSMFEIVRKLRHITDKLTKDSWTVTKMWYGSKLGDLQKKILFLEEGVKEMPELEAALAGTTIRAFQGKFGTAPPAGSMPIMVEIWDKNHITADVQFGEVGVPLALGDNIYNDYLLTRNDIHTSSSSAHSAKVTFSTSVSIEPAACQLTYQEGTKCVDISLTVKCISAKDLPDSPDLAFCKVRVKTDALATSAKRQTPKVHDSNPVFTENEWTFNWQEPLIVPLPQNVEPVAEPPSPDTFVPMTIDELSMFELVEQEVLYLASSVFIRPGSCDGSKVKPICKLLDKLSRLAVDEEALKSVKEIAREEGKGTNAEIVAADLVSASPEVEGTSMIESNATALSEAESFEAVSIFQRLKSLSEGKSGNPMMAAAVCSSRRHRGGGGGRIGGGDGGGGGWLLFGIFLLLLICCLAA